MDSFLDLVGGCVKVVESPPWVLVADKAKEASSYQFVEFSVWVPDEAYYVSEA